MYLVAQEATERACRNEGIFSLDHLRVFDEAGRGGEGRGAETDKKETWKPQQSTTLYLVHAVRVVAATPGLEVPVKLPLTRVTGH